MMRYRFDQFELDPARHELWRDGEPVALQPKVLDVLLFLAENSLRTLSKDEILSAVWKDVATTEASLVRCISLLRKELVGRDGRELIRTVRGRGYSMAVPVEIVKATVAQPRPGQIPDAEAPAGPAGTKTGGRSGPPRRLLVSAAGLSLIVLLGRFGFPADHLAAGPQDSTQPSIAVLPLLDLSPQGDQKHLADGVALALADRMSALPGIDLLSPRLSFRGRSPEDDPIQVARDLRVDLVATGTFRRSKDQIDVRLELFEARDGRERWSQSFSYPEREHLSMQRRIATELAMHIDTSATAMFAAPSRLPRSLSAYEFYLRGLRAAREVKHEELRIAIAHYQLAVEIDSSFLAGYVALAVACYELWNLDESDQGATGLLIAAESAVQRALELAPGDHAALAALAQIKLNARDWKGSEDAFRQALAVGDSAKARRGYGNLLMLLARLDEAGPHFERMIELEPLSALNQRALGRFHLYRGAHAMAIPPLEKSLQLDPTEPFAPRLMASAHHYLGNDRESRDAFLLIAPAWMRAPLRGWEWAMGPGAALRAALELDALRTGDPCREDPQGSAIAWAHLEEAESMYSCLEKASSRHLWYVQVEPVYASYRGSARFAEILERAGFPVRVVTARRSGE